MAALQGLRPVASPNRRWEGCNTATSSRPNLLVRINACCLPEQVHKLHQEVINLHNLPAAGLCLLLWLLQSLLLGCLLCLLGCCELLVQALSLRRFLKRDWRNISLPSREK